MTSLNIGFPFDRSFHTLYCVLISRFISSSSSESGSSDSLVETSSKFNLFCLPYNSSLQFVTIAKPAFSFANSLLTLQPILSSTSLFRSFRLFFGRDFGALGSALKRICDCAGTVQTSAQRQLEMLHAHAAVSLESRPLVEKMA